MADSISFRDYGVGVIRERLQQMLSHVPGVRLAEDIEAVHDMRVASRRLRAALGMFGTALQDPEFKRFEREVKAVTDALGAARDLDVMVETLEALEEELPENERAGMEEFVQEKRADRMRLQSSVARALDRLEKQDLSSLFEEIAARVTSHNEGLIPVGIAPGGGRG